MKETKFIPKRPHYYWIEKIYTELAVILLPFLDRTPVSPNMVTVSNIVNSMVIFWLTWNRHFIAVAVLLQLYLFLDILDGNLARYKDMCSKFGKILDEVSDRIFYNLFNIILGIVINIPVAWIIGNLVVYNLYAFAATFYIVPQIKQLQEYKRFGIKKFFMNRGILFGMEVGMQDVITSVLLLTPFKNWIFYSITILYLADLIYRLRELAANKKDKVVEAAEAI